MAQWQWLLTDAAFNPVGEILNARERKLILPLNKVNTASFKLRLDNPLVEQLATDLGYVKVYRNKVLMFYGPLISVQEVGEGDVSSLVATCSGPEWILTQRLSGKTAAGIKLASGITMSTRFVELLAASNAEGETHIDYTTGPITGGSSVGYETTPFRTLAEILNDMANTANGFDWYVYPKENFSGGALLNQKIGRLALASAINAIQENAVFEWGTGRSNVAKFTRVVDRSTLANRVFHIGPGGPEATGSPTVSAEEPVSISQWGLQEALVSASILNNTLRQEFVNENIVVRKQPRQTIALDPAGDDGTGKIPQLGIDFNIGDSIHFRTDRLGDNLVRVWGAEFTLDENNKEVQTLTLSNQ